MLERHADLREPGQDLVFAEVFPRIRGLLFILFYQLLDLLRHITAYKAE